MQKTIKERAIEIYYEQLFAGVKPVSNEIGRMIAKERGKVFNNSMRLKIQRVIRAERNKGIDKASEDVEVAGKNIPFVWLKTKDVSAFVRNPNYQQEDIDFNKILETCMTKYKPLKKSETSFPIVSGEYFDKLTWTDAHVAMDASRKGLALYPADWNETVLRSQIKEMAEYLLSRKKGDLLIIDDLGDFMDGFNGETTRGGHKLPQNMTNEEAFDVGLQAKLLLVQLLAPYYKEIRCNNICNDNHASSWGYVVNSAFKNVVDVLYKNVFVTNHKKFISTYFIGDHAFLITHGKDYANMKSGFPVKPDARTVEKVDQFCKNNRIYQKAKYITFCKGDSHQALVDMCSSDDFDYYNYPAFSPSSEYVQTNFKKGRRGFVVENIPFVGNNRSYHPYYFENED